MRRFLISPNLYILWISLVLHFKSTYALFWRFQIVPLRSTLTNRQSLHAIRKHEVKRSDLEAQEINYKNLCNRTLVCRTLSSYRNLGFGALMLFILGGCHTFVEEGNDAIKEKEAAENDNNGMDPHQSDRLLAFPDAEGFGQFTSGGRGGEVIYVNSLKDDGRKGTLRYAIEQSGPRTILFQVSGNIRLRSRLDIASGDLTIAGQSAPGDGICISDYPVVIRADNVIIRYMRFRLGDRTGQEADGLEARFQKNIIIDHCSVSWSTDECLSMYENENTTVQWCIIAESLRQSVHEKGSHGYGGIWGGRRATFHHNILAHHDSRNPRLGERSGTEFALTDLVDLRNNVIYNWKQNSTYGGEAMNVNIVNCYYKPGPETTKEDRIVAIDKSTDEGSAVFDTWGKFFIHGNVLTGSEKATENNWKFGVYNQIHEKYGPISEEVKQAIRIDQPHNIENNVTTHTAEEAYRLILKYGGASLSRDAADQRIIDNITSGSYSAVGSRSGTKGIIDSQEDVGGWPELKSLPAPIDSDLDGMPSQWEMVNELDPDNPDDGVLFLLDRQYTNLEVYLNGLVKDIK